MRRRALLAPPSPCRLLCSSPTNTTREAFREIYPQATPSYLQPWFARGIIQRETLVPACPQMASKLRCGEIGIDASQRFGEHCPPAVEAEAEVSPGDLWKPRLLKCTADEFQSLFC